METLPFAIFFFIFLFYTRSKQPTLPRSWYKEEKAQRIATVEILTVVEKRIKDLKTALNEVDRERKSVEAALAGAEK